MKIKLIMGAFILVPLTLIGGATLAANDSVNVSLDGKPVAGDAPAIIHDGRTLVPVRFVAEALGLTVDWNEVTRQVTLRDGRGNEILLTVDQAGVVVNGNQSFLDVPASVVNGRTYVPLRFVGEALGLDVSWDGGSRTVVLTRKPKGLENRSGGLGAVSLPAVPKMDSLEGVANRIRTFLLTGVGALQARAIYEWDGSEVVQTAPLGPMGEPAAEGVVALGGQEYRYRFTEKGVEFPAGGPSSLLDAVAAVQQRLIRVFAFLPMAHKYVGPSDCPGGARLEMAEPVRPAGMNTDAPPLVPFTGTGTVVVCPGEGVLKITVGGSETINGKPVALRSELAIEHIPQSGTAR